MKKRKVLKDLAENLQNEFPFDDLNFRDFNGLSHKEYTALCGEVGMILEYYLKFTKKRNRKSIKFFLRWIFKSPMDFHQQ